MKIKTEELRELIVTWTEEEYRTFIHGLHEIVENLPNNMESMGITTDEYNIIRNFCLELH